MKTNMLYSCKKCLKTFKNKTNECPSCGGEITQILSEDYVKVKEIIYKCPHCYHNFPYTFNICPNCGKRSKKCPNCGFNILINGKICPGCGKKI